jgi:gluconokinase
MRDRKTLQSAGGSMHSLAIEDARSPFVLAIDIGSSSVRTLIYDANGDRIDASEAQLEHRLHTTSDGGSFADARQLFSLMCDALDQTVAFAGARARDIAAVGTSCFWHGLLGLDASGEPVTPVLMWGDKRSAAQAATIRTDTDLANTMLRETGCRAHSSYWPAKLRWLQESGESDISPVRFWVSLTDYIAQQLTGITTGSISMASGTGLLNIDSNDWDRSLLPHFGVEIDQLPPLLDRTDLLPVLKPEFQQRWPVLATTPWFPAIGDGAAANLGAGCVGDQRIAVTIGTSAAMRMILKGDHRHPAWPQSLWIYRLDSQHRVVGGALSNGGNAMTWLADRLAGGDIAAITAEAGTVAPDGHGLTSLPFFAGERSPSWNDDAFASFLGLRLATTRGDIFRATLEGTAYRLAAIYQDLRTIAQTTHEIHANGGAALNSPLWMQIIADTLNHRLDALDAEAEASARGAAVSALESMGIWKSLAPDTSPIVRTFEADPAKAAVYRKGWERQQRYESAIDLVSR